LRQPDGLAVAANRRAAARTQPDLVIHLGDYHYREYCDQPALCAPLHGQGVPIGYGWAGWHADFFAPASRCSPPQRGSSCAATTRTATAAAKAGCASSRRCPYQACPNQRYKTASRRCWPTI
jgi:hypothetical protein